MFGMCVNNCVYNFPGLRAGSTATVCLLRGGVELAIGHVGDSRAILCRSGHAMELSYDHCPSVTSEKVCTLTYVKNTICPYDFIFVN